MKLREAITKAGNEADLVVIQVWADTFLASLEASGFVIVPKEATEEMTQAGFDVTGDFNQTWPAFLSKRPTIED